MIQETPAKVVSLLGVALTSLAFLFVVTATDATFSGTAAYVPDPFAPERMMAAVDTAAASYSRFVATNLTNPVKHDLGLAADNLAWIGSNAKDGALAMVGIEQSVSTTAVAQRPAVGQVAGAHTTRVVQVKQQRQSGLLDALYSVLIR